MDNAHNSDTFSKSIEGHATHALEFSGVNRVDGIGNPVGAVERAYPPGISRLTPPIPSQLNYGHHRRPHHRSHPKPLYVVAVVSNPLRFKSRFKLYQRFAEHMSESGAILFTVEQAFGDRHFAVTDRNNPHHIQVRSYDELWHKENMINLGIQRVSALYPDAEYIAWIDADVEFQREDWVNETLHQLQHYQVVQLFQQAVDLGPEGEAFKVHTGFMYSYLSGKPKPQPGVPGDWNYYGQSFAGKPTVYNVWHPGYAWAARREAFDMLGGLYDVSILGSGDHLMAWALIGEGVRQLPSGMSPGYKESLRIWQERAEKFIQRDVGYVNGTLLHHWHGKKSDRRYKSRWEILEEFKFDPEFDIKRDWQGLFQFNLDGTPRMLGLRDNVRRYFRGRNEDSIDME
jgi:hypothetical protein